MITVDEAMRRLAPELVAACDELERRLDKEIKWMKPGPHARACVDIRSDVDIRILYVVCRKYERVGWFARCVRADHGGYDLEVRLAPADEAAIYPFG